MEGDAAAGVEKPRVEKTGVEKTGVEKPRVDKTRVDKTGVEKEADRLGNRRVEVVKPSNSKDKEERCVGTAPASDVVENAEKGACCSEDGVASERRDLELKPSALVESSNLAAEVSNDGEGACVVDRTKVDCTPVLKAAKRTPDDDGDSGAWVEAPETDSLAASVLRELGMGGSRTDGIPDGGDEDDKTGIIGGKAAAVELSPVLAADTEMASWGAEAEDKEGAAPRFRDEASPAEVGIIDGAAA